MCFLCLAVLKSGNQQPTPIKGGIQKWHEDNNKMSREEAGKKGGEDVQAITMTKEFYSRKLVKKAEKPQAKITTKNSNQGNR